MCIRDRGTHKAHTQASRGRAGTWARARMLSSGRGASTFIAVTFTAATFTAATFTAATFTAAAPPG
eukprot:5516643-Prymnesium_polylepis.1